MFKVFVVLAGSKVHPIDVAFDNRAEGSASTGTNMHSVSQNGDMFTVNISWSCRIA